MTGQPMRFRHWLAVWFVAASLAGSIVVVLDIRSLYLAAAVGLVSGLSAGAGLEGSETARPSRP